MEPLFAGFAARVITPSEGVAMAGYAARSGGAVGVHDDLYTNAAVLRHQDQLAILISLDLLEVPDYLATRICREIHERTQIPMDAILVAATHTHSGPVVIETSDARQQSVVDKIAEAAVDAALQALTALEPVKVKVGSVQVRGIAKNRRTLEPSPDCDLNFIGFYAGDELKGCIINFPLHPTVLGAENRQITADYPGYLRRTVEEAHPGCCVLFFNGATGNVNIGYSADASALGEVYNFRTFEKAAEIGGRLGQAAIDGLESGPWQEQVVIKVRKVDVSLPLKDLPGVQELEMMISRKAREIETLRGVHTATDKREQLEISKIYLECLKDLIAAHKLEGFREAAVPLQAVRIGSAVLLAVPGELFAELGLSIRQSRRDLQVFIVGYANGSWGYLPTPEAYGQGGYEVETSLFARSMGDVLVKGAVKLVAAAAD